jgi:Bacterial capsule synthesis protein PGA_cap
MARRIGAPPPGRGPGPGQGRGSARGPTRALALAVIAVLAIVFVGGVGLSGVLSGHPSPTRTPGLAAAASATAAGQSSSVAPSVALSSTAPSEAPATTQAGVAIVPVTDFRSPATGTTLAEVKAILAGTSDQYNALELVSADAGAILAALKVSPPSVASRLVNAATASALAGDMAAYPDRLGFLRADEVGPSVRALAWGGNALFGEARVKSLAAWTLHASLPVVVTGGGTPTKVAYDPATAWTVFAGGDILLDRGVALTVKIDGKGVDYPFAGGTARITSHYCCSSFGWPLIKTATTGGAGAVRNLISGADLAFANFENPAPNKFVYHTQGTVFSADPALIAGLAHAGFDLVGIANNHIRDAGSQGILDTVRNLDKWSIAHAGAGATLAAARRPAIVQEGGVKVAFLAYDTIASAAVAATATRAGAAILTAAAVKADVAGARTAGAQVVIVFPHWGVEYRAVPPTASVALAHAAIDAGADMVIGNHPHWAGAMEVYKGKPIWYALGNLVFDQTWSEQTEEGITLEMTFEGPRLVQVRMRPHVILDRAQPNFLDPGGSGSVVVDRVFGASKGLLPW